MNLQMTDTILVIEDELALRETLVYSLKEENTSQPKRIVTVRGGGYRFEG